MDNYLKILSNAIKNSDNTIYSIATKKLIDRSYLSKMLSGKRKMTIDALEALLDIVCENNNTRETIINAYINDVFGESKYKKYYNCLTNDFIEYKPNLEAKSSCPVEDFLVIRAKFRLLNCASSLICNEKSQSRLFTNFPMSDFLQIAEKLDNCDFRCLISSSKNSNNSSIFDYLQLVFLNCVCYTQENGSEIINGNEFFPFMLITDECILFASEDLENGYYIKNKQLADIYAKIFISKCRQSKAFSLTNNDILGAKDTIKRYLNPWPKKHRAFAIYFSVVFFMTKNDWVELAKPDLSEKEYLSDIAYEHYKNFFQNINSHVYISTHKGLLEFCEQGYIEEMPQEYCVPLSIKTRIAILERMKEYMINTPEKFSLYFIDYSNPDKAYANLIIESMAKDQSEDEYALLATRKITDQTGEFLGKHTFITTDKTSIEEYNDFFDLFKISDKVLSSEKSIELINDAIVRLKYKEAQEKDCKSDS